MAEKPRKRTATAKRTAGPPKAAVEATKGPTVVCPRCGTDRFGPEQRTRIDGRRTVRYTVLVCERGHTFARPRQR